MCWRDLAIWGVCWEREKVPDDRADARVESALEEDVLHVLVADGSSREKRKAELH